MKEAVLKLRGTGIAGRLDSVELVKDGKLVCLTEGLYFYALSMLDGLCLTVCSRRNMTNVSDTYVELPFLSDVKFLEIEN